MAASVSELAVNVTADTTAVICTLRIIARHAQECADELAGALEQPAGPSVAVGFDGLVAQPRDR